MSDWLLHLVKLGKIGNLPNSDFLSITQVYGQPVIIKKDFYKPGDLAVFVPPDSVMPNDPDNKIVKDSGLKPGERVKARKIRGVFSNGLLLPVNVCFSEEELKTIEIGTHVAERLGIKKYETPVDMLSTGGTNESDPGFMPIYTDIEGWPRYRNSEIIKPGDDVVILEKIHGANARFTFQENRLWVGSRTNIKKEENDKLWWKVAKELNLEEKFKKLHSSLNLTGIEKTVIYGEVFGQVQKGFQYGIDKGGASFIIFDTYNPSLGRYNDWETTKLIAQTMELPTVPELYSGPWKPELEELRFGKESVSGKQLHIREGFVLKPKKETWQYNVGRVIFKFVSEDYKLVVH